MWPCVQRVKPLCVTRNNDKTATNSKYNNNNEYLERLTRSGPKRLHVLYKYILSKFNAYNMNAHTLYDILPLEAERARGLECGKNNITKLPNFGGGWAHHHKQQHYHRTCRCVLTTIQPATSGQKKKRAVFVKSTGDFVPPTAFHNSD